MSKQGRLLLNAFTVFTLKGLGEWGHPAMAGPSWHHTCASDDLRTPTSVLESNITTVTDKLSPRREDPENRRKRKLSKYLELV